MSELSGKKIVVDISIYLYKYEAENALLENMYVMLSIFSYYNIIPIFIFDGKPPPEKKALLQKRKEDKEASTFNHINNILHCPPYLSSTTLYSIVTRYIKRIVTCSRKKFVDKKKSKKSSKHSRERSKDTSST